jgi:two-component system, cell cycle sensor histidine kinase and response regulator CckA
MNEPIDQSAVAAQPDLVEALLDAHGAMGEGFAVVDAGRIVAASAAMCAMAGYQDAELLALPSAFVLVHPEDRQAVSERVERRLAGEEVPSRYRSRMIRRDGVAVPVEVGVRRVRESSRVVIIFRDISAQVNAEQSLRDTESKFRTVAEMTSALIFIVQRSGLRYVNPAAEAITGYTRDELARMDVREIIHPDSLALMRAQRTSPDAVQGRRGELCIVSKGGERRWLDVAFGVTIFEGEPAAIGTAFDVTERRRAEESLRDSEERYRLLFERNVVGVYRTTMSGAVLECNEAFAHIFGYASREAALRQQAQTFHKSPASRERFLSRLRASGTLNNYELEGQRPDGSTVWILEHVTLLPGPEGPDQQMLGTVIDITERKRTEEALRASEQRYRELFENANDIIYTHDLLGRFTSLNSAGEQITGYTREEALTFNVADLVVPEQLPLVHQMIQDKLERRGVTTYALDIIAKDGHRVPLEVSSRLIWRDGKAVGVQGIARDLTDRNTLEAQLRQSQKMEAIGRLAGGVAHDFNNMLMAIRGYSELIHQDLPPGDPIRVQLQEIISAADRATSLTRQLLAFGRKQVLRFRVIDLNAVLGNIERMLQRIIGEDIELVTRTGATQATINADPGQIEQVIINLAINARDAMPRGGRLLLEGGITDLTASHARSHLGARPGPHVMLTVSDTGTGMNPETLSHLFEPFYTTKEVGKGTGLGLSTVYGIVQQSGGHISVTSSPGVGTTFRLYFPHIVEQVEPESARETRSEIVGGTETILLVEDEASVRHLVKQVLRRKGYNLLEAQHGGEALLICERHERDIHLMITDIVMPQMSGRELVARLRSIRPALKVVYMSGYTDDSVVRHGVSEAGIAFLQKPFTPDVLLSKVRRVLDGGREA